ncbi:MAG: hypothetical protein ACRDNZ_02750 [Streptosporangiaceae bacterium]
MPGGRTPGDPEPDNAMPGADVPQGLSLSWEMDRETLVRVLNEPAPWHDRVPADVDRGNADAGDVNACHQGSGPPATPLPSTLAPGDPAADPAAQDGHAAQDPGGWPEEWAGQEAILAEEVEARMSGRSREVPVGMVAGRVAEALPPGPDLAGWLAITSPKELENGALPGVAASYRRLASWAQAGELAAIAEMASRSAASDDKIGVDDEGRPAWVPDEAVAQVSLALAMTRFGGSWWAGLAVALTWRLSATGAALTSGEIDVARARLIAADPAGADRRRLEAERRAKVSLYPDEEGIAGQSLPGTRAAAAMSRISAMARALKAAGAAGGMDLLRAQVFIGLLLGTLPVIPPAPGAPCGEPPPAGPPPAGPPPAGPPGPAGGLGPDDGIPGPGDSDMPADECSGDPLGGDPARAEPQVSDLDDEDDDDWSVSPLVSAASWSAFPALLLPPDAGPGSGCAPPGSLDLTLPWMTLAGRSAEPAHLGASARSRPRRRVR